MANSSAHASCQAIADAAPYPTAAFYGPDHLAYANRAFQRIAGFSEPEILKKSVAECLPDCPGCVSLLIRVMATAVTESHTETGYRDTWSYSAWPIYPMGAAPLTMLQITETSLLHQRSASMNEALLLSAVQQHELAQKAQDSAVELSSVISQKSAELDHSKEELRSLALQLLQAQEGERQRIARELHDRFSQELASIGMQLFDLIPATLDSRERTMALRLREQVSRLSSDIRSLSHQLHSPALEDLGLIAALHGLIESFEVSHNLAVRLVVRDLPEELPLPLATTLFRVAQEALWNAVKHAGVEALVTVRLAHEDDVLSLSVEDTGQGFDPRHVRKNGLGLVSMQERLRLVGGKIQVDASPGKGTTVRANIPWTLPLSEETPGPSI